MAAAFLLWSSSELSATEPQLLDSAPPPEVPKPKARKGGSKPPAPKRPPQRGLGVAQLERLRLQERWRKITESEPARDATLHHPTPLYGGAAWPGGSYLSPCCTVGPSGIAGYAGGGGVSAVGSSLLEQFAVDRVRVSGFGLQRGSPAMLLEPPSNQSQKLLCAAADHCDFCARKKRVYDENLGFSGLAGQDYSATDLVGCLAVDEEREAVGYYERKRAVKEYEFFPRNGSALLGDSEFGDRTVGDASSSSSAAASSPGFLDLTLKLSSR